jgi:hypothetical protein
MPGIIRGTSDQLRSEVPELWGLIRSSALHGVRHPLDPQFVFIRSLGEIGCSVRCSQPIQPLDSLDSYRFYKNGAAGIISNLVSVIC